LDVLAFERRKDFEGKEGFSGGVFYVFGDFHLADGC
jgi:hypothetical protein